MIPQIKNTVTCILVILIGSPLAGAYFAWQTGELHTWSDLWVSLSHGAFAAVMLSIGWLLFKSPFSGRVSELLMTTKTTPQGTERTTSLKIAEPMPDVPVATPTATPQQQQQQEPQQLQQPQSRQSR